MSVEVSRLRSGLIVVTDAMPHLETTSLGVWIASGSRNEAPEEHGISHFLEHMAFKGTARRSARQIAEEIEAVGGDLNAATGIETTAYYARVLRADVPLAAASPLSPRWSASAKLLLGLTSIALAGAPVTPFSVQPLVLVSAWTSGLHSVPGLPC